MFRSKKRLFCYLYAGFVIVLLFFGGNVSIEEMYAGVGLGESELLYMLYFMLYFTRVCLVMGDYEKYMQTYAINVVTRSAVRSIIWRNCVLSAMKAAFVFYFWVFACSVICSALFMSGGIVWNWQIGEAVLLFYSADMALLFLQLLLELLTNSRVAVLLTGCFYISSLFLVDYLSYFGISRNIYWILFPNLGMKKRIPGDLLSFHVWIFLVILAAAVYFTGRSLMKKKDIL